MHYVKRIKEKNDMFISVDAEKPSIGSNNIHDIKKKKKTFCKLEMEGIFFSLLKMFTKKYPTANIILSDEILKSFSKI